MFTHDPNTQKDAVNRTSRESCVHWTHICMKGSCFSDMGPCDTGVLPSGLLTSLTNPTPQDGLVLGRCSRHESRLCATSARVPKTPSLASLDFFAMTSNVAISTLPHPPQHSVNQFQRLLCWEGNCQVRITLFMF